MESLVLYLLKSAGILSLFYIIYLSFLRKDTSFTGNRFFLLGGIIASAILPFFNYTKNVFVQAPFSTAEFTAASNPIPYPVEPAINWWELAGIVYFIVASFLLLRFFLQLIRIIHLVVTSSTYKSEGFRFIKTGKHSAPFSFFNYIVFNPQSHTEEELKMILHHEKVHARQNHSLDLLLTNLMFCLLWFNPVSLFYKKSIIENLEFIADRETVAASASKKEYLQTLVKVSIGDFQPALTNSFYQSFIKKRIVMLNKKNTRNNYWKTCLIFPLVILFMLVFNVKTEAMILPSEGSMETKSTELLNYQKQLVEAHFSENTTKDQLEKFKHTFRERGIILEIYDAKFSEDNLLQQLKVKYTLEEGNSQEYVSGITKDGKLHAFKLAATFNPEGKVNTISFVEEKLKDSTSGKPISEKDKITSNKSNGVIVKEVSKENNIPGNPLYIINGEIVGNSDKVHSLDPNKIQSIHVLKDESATAVYGSAAKEGAVIIKTKLLDSINTETRNSTANVLVIRDSVTTGNHGSNNQSTEVRFSSSLEQPPPLYVIDGVVKGKSFDLNTIAPQNIKAINVIKNKGAIEKYGDKGKYGVIEVTLKTETSNK